MAYITGALRLIESFLAASGSFTAGVMIGQPAGPPETLAAAVFLSRGQANLVAMGNWQRQRDVTVRIYLNVLDEPRDEMELKLEEIVYDTEENIRTNLNLSTTGWIIMGDIGLEYDYTEVGNRMFRIADIVLPLICQT